MRNLPRHLNPIHPAAVGFPWKRLGHFPRMPPGKVHDLMLRNIRRLTAWGITPAPDSRLLRAERQLRRWIDADAVPDEPGVRSLIAEAVRTAVELYIATHGSADPPGASGLEKFRRCLGGADLPGDERQHAARDTQFELNVYGILSAGGLRPWFDESPDIRLASAGGYIGVAVKRLWSLERAHKQLSDAAGQIEASRIPGIIAANVQEYLEVLPEDEAIALRGDAFNRQVARLHGQFPYLFGKRHVIGLFACGTVAEWTEDQEGRTPQMRIATYNQLFTIANDDEEQARHEAFAAPIERALRTWMEMNL